MVCSDVVPIGSAVALMTREERLSALSPSECEHFLESFKYHKDMLVELASNLPNRFPVRSINLADIFIDYI